MPQELVDTTKKFLQYLLLRYENNYPVDEGEEADTYKVYIEFCTSAELQALSKNMFHRELKRMGVPTDRRWNRNLRRIECFRDLSKERIQECLTGWVDNSNRCTTTMEIDGVKYQVIVKLIKIPTSLAPSFEVGKDQI